jgi:hypothetical protein
MNGENFVKLRGKIIKPSFKYVGDNNTGLFKATLAIPVQDFDGNQYINIASFQCSEVLNDLPKNSFVEIQGHIEQRSYDGKCRHCGGYDKKYWTEVVVDNFVKL